MRIIVTYRSSNKTGQTVAGTRARVHGRYGHAWFRVFVHGDLCLNRSG